MAFRSRRAAQRPVLAPGGEATPFAKELPRENRPFFDNRCRGASLQPSHDSCYSQQPPQRAW